AIGWCVKAAMSAATGGGPSVSASCSPSSESTEGKRVPETDSATQRHLRRAARSRGVSVAAPQLDFDWASRFLQRRSVASVAMIQGHQIERVVWLDDEP